MRDDRAARRLILVLDENLSGHRIVDALTAHGIPVKPQTELMKRGISDEEVLEILSRHPDCCLLSKDSDFHKKPIVKAALVEHGIRAFIITSHKGKTGPELVELIVKAWGRIQRIAQRYDPPFVAKILANGKIAMVEL